MISILYTITIYPIQLILECCYSFFGKIIDLEITKIMILSILVTLLTTPLYMVAERWTEKERQIQKIMATRLTRIKAAFKGDERYMMQSEYYRQNHYHPIMVLRSSFGVLIQIPFFLAAYNFLSHLEALQGVSFLFIKDFGQPDCIFKIGSFPINILPITMTIINCISGFIYSKGHPIREKAQIYGLAFIFLIILYNSPAGLVIYWTMNNILSLVKNIFYKLKNPKKVLYIICCFFAAMLVISNFTVLSNVKKIYKFAVLFFAIILISIPVLIKIFDFCILSRFKQLDVNNKLRFYIFIFSTIALTLLAGLVIPSMLIQSEPEQFSYIDSYKSPFIFLWTPFIQSIGLFLFWPCCFYALFSSKTKKCLTIIFSLFLLIGTVNCFAFSGTYGPIEASLLFMQPQNFTTTKFTLVNIAAIFTLIFIFFVLLHFKPNILSFISIILFTTFGTISIRNCFLINRSFKNMETPISSKNISPVYHLSKEGKNVIIIMQDALVSSYVPVLIDEKPDFSKLMDGFTYYPNCISTAARTMFATPGLFGGYDYTPYYVNQRDETLQEKHNEALLSMPSLFAKEGWDVTVSDLPYENFLEQPVSKMYENHPEINHISVHGTVSDIWYERNNFEKVNYISQTCKRNFLMFSIFKMSSPFLRLIIYTKDYWTVKDSKYDVSYFIDNYSQLDLMDELFDGNSEKKQFYHD